MVSKGYWAILPFSSLKHMPHLKLSPSGVVPQRTRRPRPIMDYSFTGVNAASLALSPSAAMQFGHALPRLLQRIAYAPRHHGPPLLMKLDLSDGYYRVRLSPEAALELAVILPGPTPSTSVIGIPLCLPMGWRHSPPFFCAFTETAADIANASLNSHAALPPHPLEHPSQAHDVPQQQSFTPSAVHPPTAISDPSPLAFADIYIDDFIGLAQPSEAPRTLRAMLHAIDSIFRGYPLPRDPPARKQVISASKLSAGDGAWSTQKVILGWLLDTAAGTLSLPPHKEERILDLLQSFQPLKRTSRKKWYGLLGELRHMSVALPGARYLFSILQSLLVDQPSSKRLRLHPLVHTALQDWQHLANHITSIPLPIASLVPQAPSYIGAVDASGDGLGGFWVATTHGRSVPIAFRVPLPQHISTKLVSASNPSGTLTNSDFELAALLLGAALVATHTPTSPASLWLGSDNVAAVSWCKRGSTSSAGPTAHLLRWLAQLARVNTLSLTPIFVPGKSNTLADFCSRSFFLQDDNFLRQLNKRFPIQPSWTLVHPTGDMMSVLTSALSNEMLPLGSLSNGPMLPTPHGQPGLTSAPPSFVPLDRRCPTWATQTLDFFPPEN